MESLCVPHELDAYRNYTNTVSYGRVTPAHFEVNNFDQPIRKRVGSWRYLELSEFEEFRDTCSSYILPHGPNHVESSEAASRGKIPDRKEVCSRQNDGVCTYSSSSCHSSEGTSLHVSMRRAITTLVMTIAPAPPSPIWTCQDGPLHSVHSSPRIIIPPLSIIISSNPQNLASIKSNSIKTNAIRFRRAPLHLLHIAIQIDFPINKVFNSQRDVDLCCRFW